MVVVVVEDDGLTKSVYIRFACCCERKSCWLTYKSSHRIFIVRRSTKRILFWCCLSQKPLLWLCEFQDGGDKAPLVSRTPIRSPSVPDREVGVVRDSSSRRTRSHQLGAIVGSSYGREWDAPTLPLAVCDFYWHYTHTHTYTHFKIVSILEVY